MRSRLRTALAATTILLGLPEGAAAQEAARISGRVTTEQGAPVASASVMVQELGIGVITNADGRYLLVVPSARAQGQEASITVSLIGYRTTSATLVLEPGRAVQHDFELVLDPLRLEEVVVTGAGLSGRAERLGTARSTVNAEMIGRTNEPNIITALAQKAPNVVTTAASGEAGAGTSIRIRGSTTLFGKGEPLIVVDGTPVNNTARSTDNPITGEQLGGVVATNRAFDINPDDIESIEILKGPAATSIFGASAGAGGAILITTRKGQGGMTRYSLRSSMQFDEVTNVVPLQREFGSGVGGEANDCLQKMTPGCEHNTPTWGPRLDPGTRTYDHARELYDTGAMFDNVLAVSGGSERTTFYLSIGDLRHDGFITGDRDRYTRQTVRLNATHGLTDNLRVRGNVAYVQTDGRFVSRGNNVNGLLLGALRAPPEFDNRTYLDPETGLHRSYRFPAPRETDLIASRGFDNPFFSINEHENLGAVNRLYGNIGASWQVLPWLDIDYTLGADFANDDRMEALHVSSSGTASGGAITRWQFYERIIDHNLRAAANFDLTPTVSAQVSVGQNLNETYFRQIYVDAQELIAPKPYKLENTVNRSPPDDEEERRRLEGYFAQVELDIADQLFLTGRIRNDGASTFGLNSQRAWYPGASLAWTFTETLGRSDGFLDRGRIRIAYGESGQEPDLYQLQNTYTGSIIPDFTPGSRLRPTLNGLGGLRTDATLGNPDIRPERVGELDAGIDLGFFRGRADLSVTYYNSHARDVIFEVDTPPSTGTTTQVLNAGEIRNRGWEVSLNGRPIETSDISLHLGLNWARNRNMVLSLGEIEPGVPREITDYGISFVGSSTHARVGEPLGIFRGLGWVRCGVSPNRVSATLDISEACAGAPHGALYLGENGLPVADPNERTIGDPNPDWTAGFNAELTFRGIRLSAFVDHRHGGQVLNMTRGSLQSLGTHANTRVRDQAARPFEEWGYGTTGAVVGPGAGVPVTLGQSFWQSLGGLGTREHLLEDATFTRLREVSIAYTFAGSFVRETLGLTGIDLRVSGRNLGLWTDYTGMDPEVHTGGAAANNRGIDWFTNPMSRSLVISFGLHH